uniref:Uncharacterized protein n=1 Tax=Anguilla anguilla TaxID=7936 RepID=A0A0E9RN38_ANGAN
MRLVCPGLWSGKDLPVAT